MMNLLEKMTAGIELYFLKFFICLDLNLSWLHFNEIVHVCRCSLIEVQKYFNLKFGSQPNYDLKFINQGERKKIIVLVGFENFSIVLKKLTIY